MSSAFSSSVGESSSGHFSGGFQIQEDPSVVTKSISDPSQPKGIKKELVPFKPALAMKCPIFTTVSPVKVEEAI